MEHPTARDMRLIPNQIQVDLLLKYCKQKSYNVNIEHCRPTLYSYTVGVGYMYMKYSHV